MIAPTIRPFEASKLPGRSDDRDERRRQTLSKIDLEKFRLRTFVDRLIDMGEVEIHDEPVPLTGLSTIIERTEKARAVQEAPARRRPRSSPRPRPAASA